jgi:hypothetical protein
VTEPLARLLPWLLPPALGALAGWLVGRFALPPLAARLVLRQRRSIVEAAAGRADAIGSWILSLPLARILPSRGSAAGEKLQAALAGALGGLLGSRETIYAVRDLVSGLVSGVSARPVSEVWKELALQDLLSDRVMQALSDEKRRKAIADASGALVARQAGMALSDELVGDLSTLVRTAMPQASDALVHWLESPETRADLSERGRELLPRILEKLSDLQKLFLSAGQFDRRLNEKMPEIVDETVRALEKMARDPAQQERIVGVFSDAARGWRDSLLVTPADRQGGENNARKALADVSAHVVERLLGTMEDPEQRRRIAGLAGAQMERDGRTLGAFARDTLGIREQDVTEMICDRVLRFLTSPSTAADLSRRVLELLVPGGSDPGRTTVAQALRIDAPGRKEFDASLRAAIPQAVETALPALTRAFTGSAPAVSVLGLLGAAAGLCAGLVVIAMKAFGI